MKMPWANQTGLARTAAILATILGIASGLCGLHATVLSSRPAVSSNPFVISTGIVELLAILFSASGLLILGITAVIEALFAFFKRHR